MREAGWSLSRLEMHKPNKLICSGCMPSKLLLKPQPNELFALCTASQVFVPDLSKATWCLYSTISSIC